MSESSIQTAQVEKPDWKTWAGLWWGHVWRYFWRGVLLVIAAAVIFMATGALINLLKLPGGLFLFGIVPILAIVFLWWCFKNYIYALDAMMAPGPSFSGYQLWFIHSGLEETVTARLKAMRWLSWGMIWRNFIWALPFGILDQVFSRFVFPKLLPVDASEGQIFVYYLPFWALGMAVYAVIWIYVLKGRLGKDTKGYTLHLVPDSAAAVKAPQLAQEQWGGKS